MSIASVLSVLLSISLGNGLVGPGAMRPYSPGGGGRRHGGYVRVQDPAVGFYIGGSSIKALNGLYGRVEHVSNPLLYQLAYRNDESGWFMAMTKGGERDAAERPAQEGEPAPPTRPSEWLFFERDGRERFSHEGNSIIPGSGTRWSHVRRDASDTSVDTSGEASAADAEEELPWQVIAILSGDMMQKMRRRRAWHQHQIAEAVQGGSVPLPDGSIETAPPVGVPTPFRAIGTDGATLDPQAVACAAPPIGALGARLDAELVRLAGAPARSATLRWAEAVLRAYAARCFRHARDFEGAEREVALALALYPRYVAVPVCFAGAPAAVLLSLPRRVHVLWMPCLLFAPRWAFRPHTPLPRHPLLPTARAPYRDLSASPLRSAMAAQ